MSRVRKSVVTFPAQSSDSKAPQQGESSQSYLDYLLDLADRLLNRCVLDGDSPEAA